MDRKDRIRKDTKWFYQKFADFSTFDSIEILHVKNSAPNLKSIQILIQLSKAWQNIVPIEKSLLLK
jgi:hypothetical protein